MTTFPVKQGGIAAQQADAAAEAIAADLGAIPEARPFRPVLRGLLLTGGAPRYLRHEVSGGRGETSTVSLEPLWWPPAKIVGRHLAPFLARLAGGGEPEPATAPPGAVPVEVELGPDEVARAEARRRALAFAEEEDDGDREDRTVGEIMSSEVLVVAPEDTLGEIAERMRDRDVGSALVSDFGRLIGILTSRDLLRRVRRSSSPERGARAAVDDERADHGRRDHAADGRAPAHDRPRHPSPAGRRG